MPANVTFDGVNKVRANMRVYPERIQNGVLQLFSAEAPGLQHEAVARKPWTDITGAARQTLRAQYGRGDELVFKSQGPDGSVIIDRNPGKHDDLVLALSHGVFYGRFLELSHNGRWATVIPTMRRRVPMIIERLRRLLR